MVRFPHVQGPFSGYPARRLLACGDVETLLLRHRIADTRSHKAYEQCWFRGRSERRASRGGKVSVWNCASTSWSFPCSGSIGLKVSGDDVNGRREYFANKVQRGRRGRKSGRTRKRERLKVPFSTRSSKKGEINLDPSLLLTIANWRGKELLSKKVRALKIWFTRKDSWIKFDVCVNSRTFWHILTKDRIDLLSLFPKIFTFLINS